MLRIVTVACVAALVCACSSTWTVPPGDDSVTVVGAFTSPQNRIMADIMKYGFPDTALVRYREGYVVSYDGRTRTPRWAAERLNAKRLQRLVLRKGLKFRVDKSIPEEFRSQSLDFADSGYVRGRMAASANHLNDQTALRQTSYLSNVAPQDPRFRRGFWVQFEATVRDWARESDDLYLITGPLYLAGEEGRVSYELIGKNEVAVPTHFFKAMLRERGDHKSVQAFLVPHDADLGTDTDLARFLTTIDELERLAGLDFFSDLSEPTQSRLEAAKPAAPWPVAAK